VLIPCKPGDVFYRFPNGTIAKELEVASRYDPKRNALIVTVSQKVWRPRKLKQKLQNMEDDDGNTPN
jgi:hypothetical protein